MRTDQIEGAPVSQVRGGKSRLIFESELPRCARSRDRTTGIAHRKSQNSYQPAYIGVFSRADEASVHSSELRAQFAGAGRLLLLPDPAGRLLPTYPHSPSQSRDRDRIGTGLVRGEGQTRVSSDHRHWCGVRRLPSCTAVSLSRQSCRGEEGGIRARRLSGASTTPARRHVSPESFRCGLQLRLIRLWRSAERSTVNVGAPCLPCSPQIPVNQKLPPYPGAQPMHAGLCRRFPARIRPDSRGKRRLRL